MAYEYADRTSSLNNMQAKPNADGTYTFVVSQRDPGVYNWLDPEGHAAGMLAIRWQTVPDGYKAENAIRSVKLVPIDRLKDELAPETVFVTAKERASQRAERAATYANRLAPAAAVDTAWNTLGTPKQIEREKLALQVLDTPQVRKALQSVKALYAKDAQGRTPTGKATIDRAAESISMAAIYMAIAEDLTRPYPFWSVNAPHEWHGLKMPRSGFGIDNPDNIYRPFRVEGGARYEVRGRIKQPGPAELHFELRDSVPGTGQMVAEAAKQLATLRSDKITVNTDGSFVVAIDSDPNGDRVNHIAMPSKGNFHMSVRQLFTDWATQNPVDLDVVRLSGGSSEQPLTVAQLADRAAALLGKIAPFWVAYDNRFVFSEPANQVRTPRIRPGGRGLSTGGHFQLNNDQAWVFTVDPLGAASLGVQLTDPWGVAYDYVARTSSLNNMQAKANADGTYTFVISAQDPGVYNWLDPEGYSAGMMAIRWQSGPEVQAPEKALRDSTLVKVQDLRTVLPVGTAFVTPAERAAQQAERAAQYARRLAS